MTTVFLVMEIYPSLASNSIEKMCRTVCDNRQNSRCKVAMASMETPPNRRHLALVSSGAALLGIWASGGLISPAAKAEDTSGSENDQEEGVLGAIQSLFDSNEKTKSGKVLAKVYLNSAREVVKTLRESLKEDPKDNAKFRRTADAAKESIRDYFGNWRGQEKVVHEESYIRIERAIRSLAGFYSKAGPSTPLPEEVVHNIGRFGRGRRVSVGYYVCQLSKVQLTKILRHRCCWNSEAIGECMVVNNSLSIGLLRLL